MTNKKQTAVEWFINQLDNNQDKTRQELYYFVEKAKEMEKEQLEKEWRKGYIEGLKDNKRITKYPSGCAG